MPILGFQLVRSAVLMIAGSLMCVSQVPPVHGLTESAVVHVEVLNPFGNRVTSVRMRVSGQQGLFSAGEAKELAPGSYHLEIRLPWETLERRIEVAAGENLIVIVVPFLLISEVVRKDVEVQFASVPEECTGGLLQKLSDDGASRIPFRLKGFRTVVGAIEPGMYTVLLTSPKGICGVGGFVVEAGTRAVRVMIAPVSK